METDLLGRAIPLGDPRSLVLLDPAGATVPLHGPIIRYRLLQRLMLVMLWVVEEPCSSKQADAHLAAEHVAGEEPGSDSLKTFQQIKRGEKKKRQSKMWNWSREGRQNPLPLLPAGDDKGGYVFTEEMLALAPFAKVFATGPDDPLNNRYSFYCMLCKRNISMRTLGLYELKRHFQPDCHFREDQRLREKICPGKVRGRDGRVLYGSKLEAEREVYM